MSMYAVNVLFRVDDLGEVTLDFKGGLKVRVEKTISSGLGGVMLKIIGHEVSADHPVFGKVTLSQADIDTTPLSPLELVKQLPPTFQNTIYHDFKCTFGWWPGGGSMVLRNTKTAALVNNALTVFPPQGSVYHLQEPMDLAPLGSPDKVVATFKEMHFTVTHNP
ncbi:hypothetical protein [Polyangium fumosum]|uniref:Uncharacterized protein n=1 Tax=Polyangium fumosum TaxID=889272 RepID=A0A4U1IYT2_9BACT|nr:hypothetical protein [Polyangium fumosum]TKC99767.1 hypothetical protein E8A74_36605 [Polyangium fumosum]